MAAYSKTERTKILNAVKASSVAEAAKKHGVSGGIIYKWLKEDRAILASKARTEAKAHAKRTVPFTVNLASESADMVFLVACTPDKISSVLKGFKR